MKDLNLILMSIDVLIIFLIIANNFKKTIEITIIIIKIKKKYIFS